MPRRTRPPRAVSSTATSTSSRRRTAAAPPGPVQSPASTSRSSTRIPSEVVVPTWWPASSRMWVMRRVTVDLPLVPVIETTGMRLASSRIHDGGVAEAAAIRSVQRATTLAWVFVRRTLRAGETDRAARSQAASAMSRARSAPLHGQVTIQRPSSDARCTSHGPACSPWSARRRRVQATRSATASGHSRAGAVRPRWTRAESAGRARPVPRPRPADRDVDLDHRHQPVDVGSLEQPDLDESHGPARIDEPGPALGPVLRGTSRSAPHR